MDKTMWCVKHCDAEEWAGCEPGYYWGAIEEADAGDVTLGDTVGPFPTAADAALDMVRSWAVASAGRGSAN